MTVDVLIYDDVGMPISPERATRGLGGSEMQVLLLAQALHAQGYRVDVVSRPAGGDDGE